MESNEPRYVLISETTQLNLTPVSTAPGNSSYTFEGIFGELLVKNRNTRYYTKGEYGPQVANLQKAISENRLLGEIDHPKDRFSVKLSEVSHIIKDLYFKTDEDGIERIYGKIELLNTSKGKELRALADANVPINISSRAAGKVESDGKVKFKKLITYDVVYEPGFENAELKRINEELGIDEEGIDIFEMENVSKVEEEFINDKDAINLEDVSEDDNTLNDNVPTVLEEFQKNDIEKPINKSKDKKIHNTMSDKSKYVTEDRLEVYSQHVSEHYDSLNTKLDRILESKNNEIENLTKHNDYLVESLKKIQEYLDSEVYSAITEKDSKIEKLEEELDVVKRYAEHLSEVINENADESDSINEQMQNLTKYADYVAENIIGIDETVKDVISYNEYIAENTQNLADYSEYIAENTQHLANYSEYLVENLEHVANYSEYIGENVNESVNESSSFNPNKFDDVISSNLDLISENIEQLISKSTKGKEADTKEAPEFLNLLGESVKNDFFEHSEEVQESIKEAFDGKDIKRSSAAKKIYESVVNDVYDWEEMIPEEYADAYNELDETGKKAIQEQAELHDLTTPSKIQNFWETRNLKEPAKFKNPFLKRRELANVKINESVNSDDAQDLIDKVKQYGNRY